MLEELQKELFSFPEEECDAYMLRWDILEAMAYNLKRMPGLLVLQGAK